jgi:hypothetical protein
MLGGARRDFWDVHDRIFRVRSSDADVTAATYMTVCAARSKLDSRYQNKGGKAFHALTTHLWLSKSPKMRSKIRFNEIQTPLAFWAVLSASLQEPRRVYASKLMHSCTQRHPGVVIRCRGS